jgi:hypothetical protein
MLSPVSPASPRRYVCGVVCGVCVVVCAGFATPAQSLKHEGSPYRGLHESVN